MLRLRGTISRELPWEIMPDLFFYRDPEEVRGEGGGGGGGREREREREIITKLGWQMRLSGQLKVEI